MRIAIDPDLCQGTAQCLPVTPGLIELDELDIAHLIDQQTPIDGEVAHRLVKVCPSMAITIVSE